MADRHVASTGSNTSPYDTWAKAATTWATAISGASSGDRYFVDASNPPANVSGSLSLTFPSAVGTPAVVISGTPAATSGLSAIAAGGSFLCDGAILDIKGSVRLVSMALRTSHATGVITVGDGTYMQRHENCSYRSATGVIAGATSNTAVSHVEFENPSFRFDTASPRVQCQGEVVVANGGIDSAGTKPTQTVFYATGRSCLLEVRGFNMAYLDDLADAFRATLGGNRAIFRDCIVPAGWVGYPNSFAPGGNQVEMWNCTETNNSQFVHLHDSKRMTQNQSTYRTGGASDGTTPISWTMLATAWTSIANPARSATIWAPNTAVGSPITVTVEVTHSQGAPLQDDKLWLEVEYLGSSTTVLASLASSRTSYPTTPADVTASSASWTSAGTYKQKVSVTFTPQRAGYLLARVAAVMGSGSSIVIDPSITIS